MSNISKIRKWDSRRGSKYIGLLLGIVTLFFGLFLLFSNPLLFFTETTNLYGSNGVASVSIIVSTLMGWSLFAYGILNRMKWNSKKDLIIFRLNLGKKERSKNIIFIVSTITFLLIVSIIFVSIRPDLEIKDKIEERNRQIKEIHEMQKELNKSIEQNVKNSS